MANLFKKTIMIKDPRTGERIKALSRKWWGRLKDEDGRDVRVPLAIDKAAAQAMLNGLVRKVEQRKAGIIDVYDEYRRLPIETHLAAFETHLKTKGITQTHCKLVVQRTRQVLKGCKVQRVHELTPARVQAYLAALRESGLSNQTSNHYLRSIKQFSRWLLRDRRIADDQLAFLSMLNVSTDRRHCRRPLLQDEFSRLLAATRSGPRLALLSGEDRAMLYTVAAYTGLRASELASLTKSSFTLTATPPVVTLQASNSKRRRVDVLPLHATLVGVLIPWLETKPDVGPLWQGRWAQNRQGSKMLQVDLKAANIPFQDENDRFFDFHALRHTFITNMVKSGIHPKIAQMLARHSTIELTMNVYTSLTVVDQAAALAQLPGVPGVSESVPSSATGS